jgi:hypothetical protein
MKLTNTFKRESIDAIAELAASNMYEAALAVSSIYDGLENRMDESQRRNFSLAVSQATSTITGSIEILRVLIDNGHWTGAFGHEHLDHIHRVQNAAWLGVMKWHREKDDDVRALPSYPIYSDLFRVCADLADMAKRNRPGEHWTNANRFGHWRHLSKRMAAQFTEVAA